MQLSIVDCPIQNIQVNRSDIIGVHPLLKNNVVLLNFGERDIRDIVKMWSNKQYLSNADVFNYLNDNHPLNLIYAGDGKYWWTDVVDELMLLFLGSVDMEDVMLSALLYPPEYAKNFMVKLHCE